MVKLFVVLLLWVPSLTQGQRLKNEYKTDSGFIDLVFSRDLLSNCVFASPDSFAIEAVNMFFEDNINCIASNFHLDSGKSTNVIEEVRCFKFPDNQMVIISRLIQYDSSGRITPRNSYCTLLSQFRPFYKPLPDKLLECTVDDNGRVVSITTNQNIDPLGKEGIIVKRDEYDLLTKSEVKLPDNLHLISEDEPVAQRYQREVDIIFEYVKQTVK